MKISLDPKFRQSGQAVILYIIAVLILIVVVGIVVYLFISTIQRVVPPSPGQAILPVGAHYGGGTIIGYTNSYPTKIEAVTNATFTLMMYADSAAANVITNWSNCRFVKQKLYTGWSLAQAYADFCPTNAAQETWPDGEAPSQQFYNVLVSQ